MLKRCRSLPGVLALVLLPATAVFSSGINPESEGSDALHKDGKPLQIVGEALRKGSDELLYREFYFCSADALQCLVEYRDPVGELISRKALDYTAGPHVPIVEIEDFRYGRSVELSREPQDNLVVDAGFDNYVRSRWEALSKGERVNFEFLVVGASKPYRMKAQRDDKAQCRRDNLCLQVEIDSWLLGLVAPTIELVYSRDERQLLRFVGTSNIRSLQDKAQQVDITYRYANLAAEP